MGLQHYVDPSEDSMFKKIFVMLNECCLDKKQTRFPKSKKKRIRKKWSKNLKNYTSFPSRNLKIMRMVGPGCVLALGHPNIEWYLKDLNEKRNNESPKFIFIESINDIEITEDDEL